MVGGLASLPGASAAGPSRPHRRRPPPGWDLRPYPSGPPRVDRTSVGPDATTDEDPVETISEELVVTTLGRLAARVEHLREAG